MCLRRPSWISKGQCLQFYSKQSEVSELIRSHSDFCERAASIIQPGVKGPQQCEVQIMSHYGKLTAVVMGHLMADDGSGNRFSTSVHIVITSFITKSISCTTQPRSWFLC